MQQAMQHLLNKNNFSWLSRQTEERKNMKDNQEMQQKHLTDITLQEKEHKLICISALKRLFAKPPRCGWLPI